MEMIMKHAFFLGAFPLGQVCATPGVVEDVPLEEQMDALNRHAQADWGEVDRGDWAENEIALREGLRLLSVYRSTQGVHFWIITEADRSVTTFLLPDEY